jgi:hypothetical protein
MSTLKDQLAKLGMISESNESTNYDHGRRDDHRDRRRDSRPDRNQYSHSSRDRYDRNDRNDRFNRSDRGGHSDRRGRSDRGNRPERQRPTDPEVITREINQLFDKARLPMPPSGVKRIYFELQSGEIDFLEVDHSSYQAMSMGHINLVLDPRGRPCFLNRRALSDLRFLDPNWGKKISSDDQNY